jgi:hypothetical protein
MLDDFKINCICFKIWRAGILNVFSESRRVKCDIEKALEMTQRIGKVLPTRSLQLLVGNTDLPSFFAEKIQVK